MLRSCLPLVFTGLCGIAAAQQDRCAFDAPMVVLPADSPPFQRLLDFDADGDLDVVGHRVRSDANEYQVRVWANDGNGRFSLAYASATRPPTGTPRARPLAIAVGDFDGDGRDDFVVGGGLGTHRYRSTGAGFLRTALASPREVVDVAAADFDGDGRDDLAVVSRSGATSWVRVVWADGTNVERTIPIAGADPWTATILEADGDPGPDLVVWAGPHARVFTFDARNMSDGPALVAHVEPGMYKFAAGDIDGDGDEDLVAFHIPSSSSAPKTFDVFRRTGPASFSLEPGAPGGPAEFLADIDGDGDLDGVCCGGGGGGGNPTWPKLTFASRFEIALNDGTGDFADAFGFPGLGSTQLAGAADVDGDGDADLVAGRCVRYGRGPLTETPAPETRANLAIMRQHRIADFDRDGDPDIGGNPYGGIINRGDGTFDPVSRPGNQVPPGYRLSGPIFEGDFTGDGATDTIATLVRLQQSGPPIFERMMLVQNNGGGGYYIAGPAAADGVEFGLGDYTIEVFLAGDLDGDGDQDLVSRIPSKSVLYLNDGSGFFARAETWNGLRIEAIVDLDRDGLPDVVVSQHDASTNNRTEFTVRRGIGAQSGSLFGPTERRFAGHEARPLTHRIDVGDYDEDGYPDVAFLDAAAVPLLFCNTTATDGALGFAYSNAFAHLTVDGDGASIGSIDANLDGLMDVVVGPFGDAPNASQVFVRRPGTGGVLTTADYEAPVTQIIPERFRADVDGDGDVDLLGSSVVRNVSFDGPGAGHRSQIGEGQPGEDGMTPVLGASGPFRAGETIVLSLTGARANTAAALLVSVTPGTFPDLPFPGFTTYLDPFQVGAFAVTILTSGSPGHAQGSAFVPLLVDPVLVGVPVWLQAFLFDVDGNYSLSSTNGLHVVFGG